ncbi:MAG: hypothetical protein ABWX92_05945, partial [Mycetocola sp.]
KLSSDYEDGNNQVYDNVESLTRQFTDTSFEGNISDEYGWLRVVDAEKVEKHYCCNHTTWDEDSGTRVPALAVLASESAAQTPTITESENA